MDIRMPNRDGLSALEKIRTEIPNACVVMLSTYDNPTYVARSVALGAADYVLKASSRQEIINAITRAAAGEEPSEQSVLRRVKRVMSRRKDGADDSIPLTNRTWLSGSATARSVIPWGSASRQSKSTSRTSSANWT